MGYYVGGICIPETRHKDAPYDVWILVRPSGETVSGGCSCVAQVSPCCIDHVDASFLFV